MKQTLNVGVAAALSWARMPGGVQTRRRRVHEQMHARPLGPDAGRIARPINFTVGSTGSRSTGLCLSGSGENGKNAMALASILSPGGRSDPIGSQLRGRLKLAARGRPAVPRRNRHH